MNEKLRSLEHLEERWCFILYGEKLYKSDAVKALEHFKFLVLHFPDIFEAIDENEEEIKKINRLPLKKGRDLMPYPDVEEPWYARDAVMPFRDALRRDDDMFFGDLANALACRKCKMPNLIGHYKVLKFIKEIAQGVLEKKREWPNRQELKHKFPSVDISTVVLDLKLDDLGYVRREKPGPKPKRK